MDKKQHTIDLQDMIHDMIKSYENLPPHAMQEPVNHYDYLSLLHLISELARDDCNKEI